jgi:hypothetical protein
MNRLADAIATESNATVTEKGMSAFKSTTNACVDLFFKIGAMRGQDVIPAFQAAFDENAEVATRIAMWARDVREGAGERKLFRDIVNYLEVKAPTMLQRVMHTIPEIGRWDDLLVFNTEAAKSEARKFIAAGLASGNGLCAKWMPRQGRIATELRSVFGYTPRMWRKYVVSLTDVVEQKMCAKQWNAIEFGKLPSLASKRYSKAFQRNVHDAYVAYLGRLSEGKDKVNAGAIYPHQIVSQIESNEDSILADEMWKALPNYMGDESIIPIIDSSGSMHSCNVHHIAFALGMYIAEKGKGPFKDCFITFSGNSKLQKLTGSITQRYHQVDRAEWGGTTNIASAFEEILRVAMANRVPAADMPKIIVILSDMQFDQCVDLGNGPVGYDQFGYRTKVRNPNAMQMIKQRFEVAGYTVPKIVFWNLHDRGSNIPVKFREDGTALISGFSPSIMKSVLAAKKFTPEDIMLDTVMIDRYKI